MDTPVKKIVLVDMDGVLANFELACQQCWRRLYPDLPFIELEERTTHDIKQQYATLGENYGNKMRDIIHSNGFYATLEVMNGAKEGLDRLKQSGYEVFICTAQARNTKCAPEKAEWVNRHLGSEWVERMIITRDKTMVRGDILIDDKPVITGLYSPCFTHIIYDQPYNRLVDSGRPRLTWSCSDAVVANVLKC
jgi:5'-nucleotidase